MSSTSTPEGRDPAELLPGYYVEPGTGAWLSLPPFDPREVPSLFPQIVRWARGERTATTPAVDGPRLIHHLWGGQWSWTKGQMRFLHLWWAIRPGDPDGKWLWRRGVKRGAKGTGKDPLTGSMMICSGVGPVQFDGWDRHGRPIGRPRRMSLVQVGANSEAQASDVLRVMNGQVGPDLADELGWDPGITRSLLGGARFELLTRSEASTEGDPADDVFLNETHHMSQANGGQALAKTGRRNAAKSPGGRARVCELTNAHMQGSGTVGETSFQAWQQQVAGTTRRRDILYDSREADPSLRLHVESELEVGIAQAYADSPWTDLERIRDEAQDPETPVADSIRFYLNSLPTNELAWVEPRNWDAGARQLTVAEGEPVAMFLDCSKSGDATALRLCRIEDGYDFGPAKWCWRRPHGDLGKGWLAPREEVDAVVDAIFEHYAVQWFGVDPSPAKDDETEAMYWAPAIDEWHRRYRDRVLLWATPSGAAKNAVTFDMRLSVSGGVLRNELFTQQAMRTAAAIDEDHTMIHDGDPIMRTHVHNARRRPNAWGVSLGKVTRDSSNLVDGAVSMVGAQLGRWLVLQSGKRLKRRNTGGGQMVVLR